jgi:murein DD-endopeptidase MepM/ murein hydrolase activator NlpD
MPGLKYSYNPKTLRYERVGIRWGSVLFSLVSLLVFSGLFFVGLVFVSNKVFESQNEARLRNENEALKKHKEVVENEIYNSQELLASLYGKEGEIHRKIFLTDKPLEGPKTDRTSEILNFELADFKELTSEILNETSTSLAKASVRTYEYSKLFWPSLNDISQLQYYPTKAPVRGFSLKSLASGFGNQINPFNKRLYRHNGIDIVCEHGTEVQATGKGTIISAVRSDVPGGKGSYVVIEHTNGYQSRYSHLSDIQVFYGQKVNQGQTIGTVGASGSAVAPHIHYEILRDGKVINPVLFFIEDLSESELYELAKLNNQVKQSLD